MRDLGYLSVMVAALPVYALGFLGCLVFIPLRGGWRECMQMYGDKADKAKYAPKE